VTEVKQLSFRLFYLFMALIHVPVLVLALLPIFPGVVSSANALELKEQIYQPAHLQPIDSMLKVQVGDTAPDFTLPSINGEQISLETYRGEKNVMLSFVPAAWTPVCSDQWPGYNILQDVFDQYETIILGITADNVPTLHSWVLAMGGLWFPVLSDFWPHGRTADTYGVFRTDGTTERALIFIDKEGVIRFIHVEDINIRPPLETVIKGLEALN
jgi:peroxiredoxin